MPGHDGEARGDVGVFGPLLSGPQPVPGLGAAASAAAARSLLVSREDGRPQQRRGLSCDGGHRSLGVSHRLHGHTPTSTTTTTSSTTTGDTGGTGVSSRQIPAPLRVPGVFGGRSPFVLVSPRGGSHRSSPNLRRLLLVVVPAGGPPSLGLFEAWVSVSRPALLGVSLTGLLPVFVSLARLFGSRLVLLRLPRRRGGVSPRRLPPLRVTDAGHLALRPTPSFRFFGARLSAGRPAFLGVLQPRFLSGPTPLRVLGAWVFPRAPGPVRVPVAGLPGRGPPPLRVSVGRLPAAVPAFLRVPGWGRDEGGRRGEGAGESGGRRRRRGRHAPLSG